MMIFGRRLFIVFALAWFATPGALPNGRMVQGASSASTLPARLTDEQYWKLITDLSEPAGYFRSENLVSNEHTLQYVIPALTSSVRQGGVYMGVAPDQNFTYILAVRPRIAFIVDIRRGNLLQHLLYKAIIELSADRAEFVSRLFSKPRPPGLGPRSTVDQIFDAFAQQETDRDLYPVNLRAIEEHLTKKHGFPLTPEDLEHLEAIYFEFFWAGPGLRYTVGPIGGTSFGRGGGNFPTWEEMIRQTDWEGQSRSYLATEDGFKFLKAFQEKNLLVPVMGNFAGPKAIRAVGRYVRDHGATVTAFYVSNVEQYLFQDGLFDAWARNVATLPVDDASTFIRSVSSRFGYGGSYLGPDGRASGLDPIRPFVRDFLDGRIRTYYDVNNRSK
jgi:hypothetical protein